MKRFSSLLALFLWAGSVWQLVIIGIVFIGARPASETPIIGQVLRLEAGDERILPFVLPVTFAFVLLDVLLQSVRLSRSLTTPKRSVRSAASPMSVACACLQAGTLAAVEKILSCSTCAHNPSPCTMHFRQLQGMDAADIDVQFSQTKALIWALPVLGFIGTAFGLARAISGFSLALNHP